MLFSAFLPFVSFKADNEGKSALSLVPSSKLEEILQLLEHVYSERMSGVVSCAYHVMLSHDYMTSSLTASNRLFSNDVGSSFGL